MDLRHLEVRRLGRFHLKVQAKGKGCETHFTATLISYGMSCCLCLSILMLTRDVMTFKSLLLVHLNILCASRSSERSPSHWPSPAHCFEPRRHADQTMTVAFLKLFHYFVTDRSLGGFIIETFTPGCCTRQFHLRVRGVCQGLQSDDIGLVEGCSGFQRNPRRSRAHTMLRK